MTIRLPLSCGPERRTNSSSLIACGEPPETRVPSSSSDRSVAGPQMPSAAMPISRWNELSASCVFGPK